MYTSAVFDLDGTLLDTLQDLAAAGNHALSAMGLPTHPTEAYKQMVGHGVEMLIRSMLPEASRKKATEELALCIFEKYYRAHMNDLTAPYPGIVQMLGQLREDGVRLAVLSNKADGFVQEIVQQHFPDTFDIVMGLQEGIPAKPDPTSLLQVLRQMDVVAEDTLYCGDSDIDIYTGANAAVPTCGVLWGFRSEEELRGAGATLLVADAAQLEEMLLSTP